MNTSAPLDQAIGLVGLTALARECKVSHQAVRKWQRAGRMPRTEWTGETAYSVTIERITGGEVRKADLLRPWPAVCAEEARDAV
jgi:hypothetical protein